VDELGLSALDGVVEIELEHCPNCGGELKIIAAILVRCVAGAATGEKKGCLKFLGSNINAACQPVTLGAMHEHGKAQPAVLASH
jgi:hypothetical protein